jgi:phosphoglycolate phosphatase
MSKKVLVFDLDGTLADTRRDLVPVLNRTVASSGIAPLRESDIGPAAGQGAKAMIELAFRLNKRSLDSQLLETLFVRFIADYERNIAVNTVLFDGALRAMRHFRARGWRLAVCTNKMQNLADKLLAELGVAGDFAAVDGGDAYPFRKPDPRHLLGTIERAGGQPHNAVMVGDSRTDIDAARAAGVPVVAVDFGYSDIAVADLSPDAVISHFDELPHAVTRLNVR